MSCGSEWEAENAYIAKDLLLEIARKSIELGRSIGKTESKIENKRTQGELNDLTKNQAYDKGFITAMKLYARPKGKWKKVKEERCAVDMSGEIATRYKCSECGRTITILPSKLSDYPFCHCGADMRKGGPEE